MQDKHFNIKDVCSEEEVESPWGIAGRIMYVKSPDIKKK